MTDQTMLVAAMVEAADSITVLTGAGISTESGIPDYRGPNGVWTTNPASMRLVDINAYLADPQVRRDAWQERMHHPAWTASPSAGHTALVELERSGKLRTLATQNIDGLHQAAGSQAVLELHGTIHHAKCLECGRRTPMQEQLERVRAGDPDPACSVCGGIQKSATVAFGESLDGQVIREAVNAAKTCQVFLAIGTSLTVQPAASLFDIAQSAGASCMIINTDPTVYDQSADAVVHAPIGEVLPAIVTSALANG
jgi:NAD-dependent deacetylase